jgi:hypothetical protein
VRLGEGGERARRIFCEYLHLDWVLVRTSIEIFFLTPLAGLGRKHAHGQVVGGALMERANIGRGIW